MTTNKKVLKQMAKMEKAYHKIKMIQEDCPHTGAHIKYGSDTGNYCKQDDSYWIDWDCPTCGKTWSTDQGTAAYAEVCKLKAIKI